MTDREIRPFAAVMPVPIEGESILGFFSRALDRTLIVKLKQGLALADVQPAGNTSGINIVEAKASGLAILFKADRTEIVRRLHPKTSFDHWVGKGNGAIDFFGTKIRTQYLETIFRRVAPRSLSVSPHHLAIWDLRLFSFDPSTRENLLKSCPVCGERLRWIFVRGPTHCDNCVTDRGLPKTDLRDYPQPVMDFEDEEAIDFVVNLVDPDAAKRESVRRLLPEGLKDASNSDVFEAVVTIASCFRPENVTKTIAVGRPLRSDDFEGFTPDLLEIAGRMVIGGADGFAAGTARLRAHMAERDYAHGMYAEIGPLAGTVNDRSLAPVVREFLIENLQKDLMDTSELGLIRRRLGVIKPQSGGPWVNMQEAFEIFGVSKHPLQRLVASGLVKTRRTDTAATPILLHRDELAPIAARYKDTMDETRAKAALRVSTAELEELVERGLVERADAAVSSMLGSGTGYRGSSVNAVVMAIKKRAVPADPSLTIGDHLLNASRRLPSPVPWPSIIELILSGDIKIRLLREEGNEWRRLVAPMSVDDFETIVRAIQSKNTSKPEAWMNRTQAAQVLNIADSSVHKMAVSGFLPSVRHGKTTRYRRSDIEKAAKKYVFLPEMLARSPFRVEHEVGRWLRSVGIEPLAEWTKSVFPIFDRASFERVLPSMPPAVDDVDRMERDSARVPTDIRRKAVEEVNKGLSPYFVARRLGLHSKALKQWAAYFEEHGEIPPAGKLEAHEDYIRSAIDADPTASTRAIWLAFKKRKTEVGLNTFYKFVEDLGYRRDAAGHLVLKH